MNPLIEKFKSKCDAWNQNENIDIVFNKRLESIDLSEIKYIIVGDNPGGYEKEENEYLVGSAGIVTRLFFERFLVKDFDKEVIVLNKTPISTKKSEDLQNLNSKKILKISQLYIANLVYNLSMNNDIKVIIMGISSCRKSDGTWTLISEAKKAYFCCFFKQIQYKFKSTHSQKLFFIKHFSRNSFFNDFTINDYRNNPKKAFLDIGTKYKNELFQYNKTSQRTQRERR